MRNRFKFLIYGIFLGLVFLCNPINAFAYDYEVSVIPYNVTDACDLAGEGGQVCFAKAFKNEIDDYIITDNVVKKDQIIMLVVNVKTLTNSPSLIYMRLKVAYDQSKLTPFSTEEYGTEVGDLSGNDDSASYIKTVFPAQGRDKTTWTTSTPVYSNGYILAVMSSGDKQLPFQATNANLHAVFFVVNEDAPAGGEIPITITNENPSKSTLSDISSNELWDVTKKNNLTLSIFSDVSSDGTLKTLTATGSNGKEYPFGFVSSDKTKLEYEFVVPNAVENITFSGTATDSSVKSITGLDTVHNLTVGDNNKFNISVVAQDGNTTIYKIKVKRLSNDATLQSITAKYTLDGVETNIDFPSITSGTLEYSATVPYKVTSADVELTPNYSDAVITSLNSPWSITTDDATDKKNTFIVNVKSEECDEKYKNVPGIPAPESDTCKGKDYKFNITRTAPSKNLNLATLTVGSQSITIDNTKDKYEVVVDQSTTNVNIAATLEDTKNILSGTGNKTVGLGDNTFKLTATGEDGKTTKEYTITVHRAQKELQSLTITTTPDNGTLKPNFNATANKSYTYEYPATATKVSVTATVIDTDYAYVNITDGTASSDKGSLGTLTKEFPTEEVPTIPSTIKVVVTSADGNIDTYTISMDRAKSTNNYLSSLTISPGSLNETFKKETKGYTATVDADVDSITVTPTLDDSRSTLGTITGNTNLSFGTNTITIPVTSESGSETTYTITVTRKKSTVKTLADLRVGLGDDTPTTITGWNKTTYSYDLYKEGVNEVPYETDKVTIAYTKDDENQTVTGDVGTKTLNPGDNTFTITVQPQDETATPQDYVIKIYRTKNNDNTTKGVTVAGVAATKRADGNYEVTLPNSKTTLTPNEVVISKSNDATLTKVTGDLTLSTTSTNEFEYMITSAKGEVANYTIYITREKATDVTMSTVELKLDGDTSYTLSCTPKTISGKTNKGCTINVPAGTLGYILRATIHADATVNPLNDTHYDMPGDATGTTQVKTLTVTAEDKTTTAAYDITINRAKSSVKTLESITVTDVTDGKSEALTLNPSFASGTTLYNITVPATVKEVVLGATKTSDASTITTDLTEVYTLPFGNKRLEIAVKAEDNTTNKYYIDITRSKGINTNIAEFKIDDVEYASFADGFDYGTVDYDQSKLERVSIKTEDELARISKITVNGNNVSMTAGKEVITDLNLKTGVNTIVVTVTAHDTTVTKDYTWTVTRTKNNDTSITGIQFKDGSDTKTASLDTSDSDSKTYQVTVSNKITEANDTNILVSVNSAINESEKAKVSIATTELKTLDASGNTVINVVPITITAEDGTIDTYYLNITRTPDDNKTMTRVNAYLDGASTPGAFCLFEGSSKECTLNLGEETAAFTLEGILAVPDTSKVEFTDGPAYTLGATESEKTITATVTAEDKTTATYTINIKRAKSSNNYLVDLKTNANSETLKQIDGFIDSNPNYTLEVPATQSDITIEATADAKAKINQLDLDGSVIENTNDNQAQLTFTRTLLFNEDNANKPNTIKIQVTAENGSKHIYTVTVTRKNNTDASLKKITLNSTKDIDLTTCSKHLSGPYNGKTVCSVEDAYDYAIASLYVTAETTDARGYYKETGSSTNGAFTTELKTIYYGRTHEATEEYINAINIRSYAHDTSVYEDYVLLVKREASSNTSVEKVEFYFDGKLNTATKNGNVYEIEVPNSITKVTKGLGTKNGEVLVTPVTPEKTYDAYATVQMDDLDLVTSDVNHHKFKVIAEDGTEKEYEFNITRKKSSEARLENIIVESYDTDDTKLADGTFNKTFNKENATQEYTVTVPVDATKVKLNITKVESHSHNDAASVYNLDASTKQIVIHSFAEDGSGPIVYTFNIKRVANTENNLKTLTVKDTEGNTYQVKLPNGSDFTTTLTDNTKVLKVEVPGDVDTVIIEAEASTTLAGVTYLNQDTDTINTYSLNPNSTKRASIQITSESGVPKIFQLDVVRLPRTSANLTNLSYTLISTEDTDVRVLDVTDTGADINYDVETVLNKYSQLAISASVDEETGATVSFPSGNQPILTGPSNSYVVTVTAEDGITKKNYTININREYSDEARLQTLDVTGITLNPSFDKDTYEYNIEIPNNKSTFDCRDLSYTLMQEDATPVCDATITIDYGETKPYHITVIPESEKEEAKKIYTIQVKRALSKNNYLGTFAVSGGSISPTFDKEKDTYTIYIPLSNTTGDFTITATAEDANATVSPNDIDLGKVYNITDSPVEIEVTPQDPSVPTKKYTFTIERVKSNEASLTSLSVIGYPFKNTFTPTTYDNVLNNNLDRSAKQLTVSAIPKNDNAKIKYSHEGVELGDCENERTCKVDISDKTFGTYKITVTVIPENEDDSLKKVYTISYTIARSDDNYLTDIEVVDKSLEQIAFTESTKKYEITVANEVENVELKITPCAFATVEVDGNPLASDKRVTISDLTPGSAKKVEIKVTSESGKENTYTVTINRLGAAVSNDNYLKELSVKDHPFDTTFAPTHNNYSIGEIPWSTTELTINAKKNHDAARIEYYVNSTKQSGNVVTIPKQENITITVKVIAEDTSTNDYVITLSKKADTEINLANIEVNKGTLKPAFKENETKYEVSIPYSENSINIIATAKNNKQAITMNGDTYTSGSVKTINDLSEGTTTITIIVTSEYGTTKTYTIKVSREATNENITSDAYGHIIEDGYIKSVSDTTTALDIKNQLDNDNAKLEIWDKDEAKKLSDSDQVGTACIVKLVNNATHEELDRKIIVVKGDTNGDGIINMIDAAAIANHFMERTTLTGVYFLAGDVNVSGVIDMIDVAGVANHFMERSTISFK